MKCSAPKTELQPLTQLQNVVFGGSLLFENLSAEQLKGQGPEIHELIKTGVAGDARVGKPKIDASFR